MSNQLSRYADGVMEAAWLAAVVLLPVFFNLYSSRIFEPDKISILRSLALLILAAWLVKAIAGERVFLPAAGESRVLGWRQVVSAPLVWPALAWGGATLLSTLFSLNPYVSFWGSYQRLQGAYTTLAYLVIFFAMLANMRSPGRIQRLVTTIVVGSLPVALYGILQRYQLDPIPWGGDVSVRVASNLGNSIFLAAYLIMVIPLVGGRILLAFQSISRDDSPRIPTMLKAAVYVFILIIQLYALYLSGSRGPALGWLAGSFFMLMGLAAYTHKRWLVGSLAGFSVLAIIFLALFNTQGGVFETLRSHPAIGRFGKLLDQQSNTALVRKYIWEGAARLVAPHAPLAYPYGSYDTWNSLRLVFGYGPESMIIAYTPFYPPELAHVERRNAIPDRSHNEIWDALINGGLLGLSVYLATILMIFYHGLKWLGFVPHKAWKVRYWLLLSLSGLFGGLILFLRLGAAYLGIGLPIGLVIGLALYLILLAWSGQAQAPGSVMDLHRTLLILSLLAAVLAHILETNFGISIGVTRAYFWIFAALLVLIGLDWVGWKPGDAITQKMSESGGNSVPVSSATQRTRQVSKGHHVFSETGSPWLESALFGGFIVALLCATMGYIFLSLNSSAGADIQLFDIWASLTSLKDHGPGSSWALVSMVLISLVVASFLVGVDSGVRENRSAWWKITLGSLAAAVPLVLIFWVWHARSLIAIANVHASTIQELMRQVDRFKELPSHFWTFVVGLIFLLSIGTIGKDDIKRISYPPKILVSAMLFTLAVWLGVVTNLRPIQADVVVKLAGQFDQPDSWPVGVQVYQKAIDLAPRVDDYYLFLGQAYLEYANTVEAGPQRDGLIEQARTSLLTAQALNPLNPDHSANLARLYNLWALFSLEPADRLARAQRADEYFANAVRLSPNHARLWNEWSLLHRDVFQDEQRSLELLEHSLELDPQYDWTYALLGDLYLRQGSRAHESGLSGQADQLFEQALAAYESALDYVADDAVQSIGMYQFVLVDVYRYLGKYHEAITLLSEPALREVIPAWRIAERTGRIYQAQGDLAGAKAFAQQALDLAPQEQHAALEAWINELEDLP